jgi:hypothetical protein
MQSENNDWLDEMLDGEPEDPIVSETNAFGYMAFVESMVMSSIMGCTDQGITIDKLNTMRKSEMDALLAWCKENQNHKDCREQFKDMCRKGVFNNNDKK